MGLEIASYFLRILTVKILMGMTVSNVLIDFTSKPENAPQWILFVKDTAQPMVNVQAAIQDILWVEGNVLLEGPSSPTVEHSPEIRVLNVSLGILLHKESVNRLTLSAKPLTQFLDSVQVATQDMKSVSELAKLIVQRT